MEVVVIGDRFWFQKDSSGLSPAQLRSVQTTSLAGLLCANLPDLRYVQPSAFLGRLYYIYLKADMVIYRGRFIIAILQFHHCSMNMNII